MKKTTCRLAVILLLIACLAGCVKLALRATPSLISNMSQVMFEECDPLLAKQSIPGDLKLMEGLLKSDPENVRLLTALCTGFTGYAMLFVEDENAERASRLYLRARNYGLKALGITIPFDSSLLETIDKEQLEVLFWTTMAWNAWIGLNLDKPAALAQLNVSQACLKRVLEIDGDYFFGTPYILMGSILAARPESLGGDKARAKEYFDRAIGLSNGKFFLAQYYFARYYAVRVQNKELFIELIKEVSSIPSDKLKETCLINAVIKQKAKHLLDMSDELFL